MYHQDVAVVIHLHADSPEEMLKEHQRIEAISKGMNAIMPEKVYFDDRYGDLDEGPQSTYACVVQNPEPKIELFIDEGRGSSIGEFIKRFEEQPVYVYPVDDINTIVSTVPLTLDERIGYLGGLGYDF